ncbi:hypothetical protein BDA96_07G072100 [Sorghum bicolor]|uniref:Uncharacterized protein n=2 Tax=Sorghum bicolor TaxID=4558 RepID=A0A921QIL4_SORBI|nr:hypothetical protein BDA96_07G072100 [Sorghum bicolor]KXG24657.1 hypothetical protein SORBI_3007G069300 [Sorghum bicolor]
MMSGWAPAAYYTLVLLLLLVLGVVTAQSSNGGVGRSRRQEEQAVSEVSFGNLAHASSPMESIGKLLSALIYTYCL